MQNPHTLARRRPAVFATVLGLSLLAQLAGPLAARADDIGTVAPAVVCETAPIDAVRLAEATADLSDDQDLSAPVPYAAPDGTVAGAVVIDQVRETVDQVVACANEGRISALLALFTDAFLGSYLKSLGVYPDLDAADPLEEGMRLSVVRVADVTVLADERVAALVILDQGEREGPELTSLMTFRPLAGRLLIDVWQPVTLPEGIATTPVGTPVAADWDAVSGPGYGGVIVPVDAADEFRFAFSVEPAGYWLPDAGLIAELEAGLPGYLRTFSDDRAVGLADQVGDYERQYAGVVVEGRAVIYVNAFCDDPIGDGSWRHAAIFVMDGGDCFFQFQYVPATKAYRDLQINGDA